MPTDASAQASFFGGWFIVYCVVWLIVYSTVYVSCV